MRAGDVLGDRFEIERLAGSGGMGAVYRAKDRLTGRPVALKVLRAEGQALVERFGRESRVLATLEHTAIVRYVTHGATPEGEPYLAMEWLEGEDLAQRLARSPPGIRETVALVARIAEALGHAHARGIVHRDIKPSNVFLAEADITRGKLLDFGIARTNAASHAPTRTGLLLGTPGYMAPEQARGARAVDARADVFSLGCVLLECLTGRPAFLAEHIVGLLAKVLLEEAPRAREQNPRVPLELDNLVARMLAKDPAERPPDGAAVATELRSLPDDTISDPLDEPKAAGTAGARSLTAAERRLVCVIMADVSSSTIDDSLAPTITPDQVESGDTRFRNAVAPFASRFESLPEGKIVAVVVGKGNAKDQAAQAARCALALRRVAHNATVVLTTGYGVVSERLPVGEAIDRAVRTLRSPPTQDAGPMSVGMKPIVIDEISAHLLEGRFDVSESRGTFTLRADRELDVARTLLGKPTPCVGREFELGLLGSCLEQSSGERVARAILVTAPPGAGKSRVRHEFLRRLAKGNDAPLVWTGLGDPMSAGSPFGLLGQALRRATGILEGEPLEERRAKLKNRVAEHVAPADAPRIADFLGELIGTAMSDEGRPQLRAARQNAMLMGDQMRRAWEEWLAAECEANPVLLVLEDLHWGDLPTVQFVDGALRNLADRPFMVLALARPEVHDVFPRLWEERHVQELRLSPLQRRASEKLVKDVLGAAVPAEQVAHLVERAQGNALYLEELIRAHAEGKGTLLPETVLAMVQSRIERLPSDSRRVLRAASIFGEVFWEEAVVALLSEEQTTLHAGEQIASLVEREIVVAREKPKLSGQSEYAFRHGLMRDAAYATLTEADRAVGHKLAGEWLEKVGGADPLVLAEHKERGGEPSEAVRYYVAAARDALEGNDLAAVVHRAERGVACGAEGSLLGALRVLQMEAHGWRGEWEQAERCTEEAVRLLPRGSMPSCRALGVMIGMAGALGRYERLPEQIDALVAVPPADDAAGSYLWASLLSTLIAIAARRPELAGPLLARVTEVLGAAESREPALAPWTELARTHAAPMERGEGLSPLRYTLAVAELFERTGDLRMAALARVNLGSLYVDLGAHEEAERALRLALSGAERVASFHTTARAKNNLAIALVAAGAATEAERVARDAAEMFATHKNARYEGVARRTLARALLQAGRLDEAVQEATRSAEVLAPIAGERANALSTLACVHLARNSVSEAVTQARLAYDLRAHLDHVECDEAYVRLAFARALHAAGFASEAKEVLREALRRVEAHAAAIDDDVLRRSFLERVEENATIVSLAHQ